MREPLILRIKRNSLDDGPGIRTTVFFKGCPLDCAWCHNPESKSTQGELQHEPERCVGCGACRAVCEVAALTGERRTELNRTLCTGCGACAKVCPTGALEWHGRSWDVAEIAALLRRDLPFFRTSGGGLTLSGGEPTMFAEYAGRLLHAAKGLGTHTLLETCGLFEPTRFADEMLPWLDGVYVDVKLMDPAVHRLYCGADPAPIFANVRRLGELARAGSIEVLPRVPLVPGITDTDDNLRAIAAFLRDAGFTRVALLGYNPTWPDKARRLGREVAFSGGQWTTPDEWDRAAACFDSIEVVR